MAAQLDANGLPPLQTLPTPPPREPEPEPAPAAAPRPPKRWAEVITNPRFQALSSQEQEEARNQYFDEVVRPQIGADEVAEARKQFDASTKIGKLSGFAHDARQTLDRAADVAGPVIDKGLTKAADVAGKAMDAVTNLPPVRKLQPEAPKPARMAQGGVSDSRLAFAERMRPYAEATARRTGIDPDILIAHAAQETGWGNAVADNNFFNITGSYQGKSRQRGDRDGSGKSIRQSFRMYDDPQQSFDDLAGLLGRKYKGALGQRDPMAYGSALKAGGYAADPGYASHIAERYNELQKSRGHAGADRADTSMSSMPEWGGYQRQPEIDLTQRQPGSFQVVGMAKARDAALSRTDPRLVEILKTAAETNPEFSVQVKSGWRPVNPKHPNAIQHPEGAALDVNIIDRKTGKPFSGDYQNAQNFGAYERFAQHARRVQEQLYPELNDKFIWGGYFGGGKGKYGAVDLMHFDLRAGNAGRPAGGDWEHGLNEQQRRLFPGAASQGMGPRTGRQAWRNAQGQAMPEELYGAGIKPAYVDTVRAKWDAAGPGERASMLADGGVLGRVARHVQKQYDDADAVMSLNAGLGGIGTRREDREDAYLRTGVDLPLAKKLADRDLSLGLETQPLNEPRQAGLMEQAGGDLMRGMKNLQAMGPAAQAWAFDVLGDEQKARAYLNDAHALEREAEQQYPQTIGSYEHIDDKGPGQMPGRAAQYLVEKFFENLPTMLPTLALGGVGGAAGKAIAQRTVGNLVAKYGEARTAELIAQKVAEGAQGFSKIGATAEAIQAQGAAKLAQQGLQAALKDQAGKMATGAALLGGGASIPMETASIYSDIDQQTGQMRPGQAAAAGLAAGSLDALPAVMAAKRLLGEPATEFIKGELVKRLGTETAKQALAEGFTELPQTLIEIGAVRMVDGKPFFTEETLKAGIDAWLAGSIGGGGVGLVSQGITEARQASELPARAQIGAALQDAVDKAKIEFWDPQTQTDLTDDDLARLRMDPKRVGDPRQAPAALARQGVRAPAPEPAPEPPSSPEFSSYYPPSTLHTEPADAQETRRVAGTTRQDHQFDGRADALPEPDAARTGRGRGAGAELAGTAGTTGDAGIDAGGLLQQQPGADRPAEPAQENPAAPDFGKGDVKPFDSAQGPGEGEPSAFHREYDARVKASKAAGNTHLDELDPSVEGMRGKSIYSVHDPKVTGKVRTVDNRGNVYVDWADQYSTDKEMAQATKENGKIFWRSSLGPTDLKDYVVGKPSENLKGSGEAPFDGAQGPAPFDGAQGPGEGNELPARGQESTGTNWDELTPAEREGKAAKAGWRTQKGAVNAFGKKLAQKAWADIKPDQKAKLQAVDSETEAKDGQVQTAPRVDAVGVSADKPTATPRDVQGQGILAEEEAASGAAGPADTQAGPDRAGTGGAEGLNWVEHVTAKGKTLRGIVRKDLTAQQAKQIDPFTFKKDGGFFIRDKHVLAGQDKKPAATTQAVASPKAATKPQGTPIAFSEWIELPGGYKARQTTSGPMIQEIRTPNGNILTRGIDTNGNEYREFEGSGDPFANGALDWIDKALSELANKPALLAQNTPNAGSSAAPETAKPETKPTDPRAQQHAEVGAALVGLGWVSTREGVYEREIANVRPRGPANVTSGVWLVKFQGPMAIIERGWNDEKIMLADNWSAEKNAQRIHERVDAMADKERRENGILPAKEDKPATVKETLTAAGSRDDTETDFGMKEGGTTEESSATEPGGPSAEEMEDLKAQMGQAFAELATLLGAKTNLTEEEETRLLPIMSKIFRIAAKMGYIQFKEAGRYVITGFRQFAGDELADKLSIDNLQAGYINIAKEIGGDKKAALAVESLEELMAEESPSKKAAQRAQERWQAMSPAQKAAWIKRHDITSVTPDTPWDRIHSTLQAVFTTDVVDGKVPEAETPVAPEAEPLTGKLDGKRLQQVADALQSAARYSEEAGKAASELRELLTQPDSQDVRAKLQAFSNRIARQHGALSQVIDQVLMETGAAAEPPLSPAPSPLRGEGDESAPDKSPNLTDTSTQPPKKRRVSQAREDNDNAARTDEAGSLSAGDTQGAAGAQLDTAGDSQPLDTGLAGAGEAADRDGAVSAGAAGAGRAGSGRAGGKRRQLAESDREGATGGPEPGVSEPGNVDHQIDAADLGKGGLTTKFRNNVKAIKIIQALEAENRSATGDERKQLAKYVGWGALKGVFDPHNKTWAKQHQELRALLNEAEWASARASILNAHYTSPAVVGAMYQALERLGFTGGHVLEPAMGSGNFFGLMPSALRQASKLHGVELDNLTSRLAKALYPNAVIAAATGFQDYAVPADYFDLAIGNPPFGSEKVPTRERTPYANFSIHNYFLARMLDKVREGGLVVAVVSHNFMDVPNSPAREWMAQRANLIGAVRLPFTAFLDNAGTEVVTDIVIFQKTATPMPDPAWVNSTAVTLENKEGEPTEVNVNDYFRANPGNVLGRETATGKQYRAGAYNVEPTGDLAEQLGAFMASLPQAIYESVERPAETLDTADNTVPAGVKQGSFYVAPNGQVRQRGTDVAGQTTSTGWAAPNGKAEQRMKGMIELRDLLREQLRMERDPQASPEAIEAHRDRLKETYAKFLKAFGYLNNQTNRRIFNYDTEANLLQALEFNYDKGLSKEAAAKSGKEPKPETADPADILNRRVSFPPQEHINVSSARDALLASLNAKGRVDLDYLTEVYGKPDSEILKELGDTVYRDPLVGGWQTADEYLSGDVKTKLEQAKAAAEEDRAYRRNVEALEKVIPKDKLPSEIYASLGAGWIPTTDIQAFAREISGNSGVHVQYVAATAQWITAYSAGNGDRNLTVNEYGTERLPSLDILDLLLKGKPVEVKDRVADASMASGYRLVTNEAETEQAKAKADKIKALWEGWLFGDAERGERLAALFNEKFNRTVARGFDGSHLTLPGITPTLQLRAHQKDVIWRGIQERNVLLDHVVGAGKTFAAVATVMEMKRLGIARKPLVTVPNHLTQQWKSDFYRLYPAANVLAAEPEDFAKGNRERLFSKIATGDWDAVVIGHSSLKKVGLDPEIEARFLKQQLDEISAAIEDMKRERGDKNIIRDMEKIKSNLDAKINDLIAKAGDRDKVLSFNELGIDAMLVDEHHEFKNLFFTTQKQRVSGLGNPKGSGKAFDLFFKIRWLQETFGENAPLITATGTPVSNSLAEMFTMQRYMRYDELKRQGIHLFDAWANLYGSDEYVYEVAPSGVGYRISQRFAKFKNLPSLMGQYRQFADVVTLQDLKDQSAAEGKRFPVPAIEGGKPQNIVAQRSKLQRDFFGVPEIVKDDDGNTVYQVPAPAAASIEPNAEGKFVLQAGNYQKTHETREEAALDLVTKALTPAVTIDPKSIVGQFENLAQLTRDSKGKINALSLTGLASKAGLDMRLINESAPDNPGSKINLAIGEMMRLYRQWGADKGTQLVFCDLSVPASARAAAAIKERYGFVRENDGSLRRVKATVVTVKGLEGVSFLAVRSGGKGADGGYALYDGMTGTHTGIADHEKAKAVAELKDRIEKEGTGWLEEKRAGYAPIEDSDIADWQDANDVEADEENSISMDELNALAGGQAFSVYDDIKAKLIREGVPAHEIAFIHDYHTPKKKAELFKQMNRGEVRFLLGSTPKLGAGTNVQQRLVGLHHIDAPWRPSDLEQREGRIIRQGNSLYERDPDGFTVFIGRYATEQTYDTRRWQIIEHKASGIEQLRKYSGELEIEDVGGEAANAADMKAAASGNPLILEETRLRNEVKRLTALQKAWLDGKASAQRQKRWATEALTVDVPKQEEAYQELIGQALPASDDPKKLAGFVLDGKAISARDEALKKLGSAIQAARKDNGTVRIEYRGLSFRLDAAAIGDVRLSSPLNSQMAVWYVGDEVSPSGLLTRLNNWTDALKDRLREQAGRRKKLQADIALAEKIMAEPFADAADLEVTRARHTEVQRKLMKSSVMDAVPAEAKAAFLQEREARKAELEKLGYAEAVRELEGDDAPKFSRRAGGADTLMAGGRDGDPVVQADDQAAAEALNAGMVRYFKDKRWENAYVQVELPDALSEFQQAVAAGFGRELVGVIGRTRGARAINGVNYQGKLFVNVNADVGFVQLGGHELLHQLKRDRPDLYRWFAARARNHYRDLPAYQAKLNALLKPGEDPYNRAAAEEELLGDFAGDALADPAFVEKLAKADPSRFKQLLNAVIRWLKQVGERLTGKGLGSSQYFKDVEALREHLATALVAYAQGGPAAVGKMQRAKFHTAWHGSPHDHDRFSTSKIGTGEGAQAFGYGLYFTNAKDIAEHYRDRLSAARIERWTLDGRPVRANTRLAKLLSFPAFPKIDARSTRDEIEKAMRQFFPVGYEADKQKAIDLVLSGRLTPVNSKGRLYQVELAPAEDEYLDWHKPLSEQSEKVKAALRKGNIESDYDKALSDFAKAQGMPLDDAKLLADFTMVFDAQRLAEAIYYRLTKEQGSKKAASEYLHSLGIRGIRYPAEGQTGGKSGDRFNYVIFDENDVEITAKFSRRSDLNTYPDEREGTGLELDPEAWADVDADTLFAAIDGAGKDGGGAWGRAGEAFDALSGQARRQVLGLLTVHQLVEQGKKVLPRMERYLDEMNRMDATRGRIIHEADAIAADWRKLDAKTKQRLAYVMHESTIAGVDGAVDYTPSIDVGAAKKRIKALYGLQRGAGGDKRIAQWQEEIRDLKAQLGFEEKREQEAERIHALFAALTDKAQAVYVRSRDFHVEQSKRVEEALVAMIERAEMSGKRRAAAIQQLRKDFESQRVQAPYFPLARQGDYWVSVAPVTDEDGKVIEPAEFHTFQSYGQQSAFFEARAAEGREVARGKKLENLREVQGVSAGFVADTLDVIGQLGDTNPAVEDVRDQVYQLYLKSLPELSSRKHSIHRKKTRGFGEDALRAFAEKASHDAYAYARIQHGFELRQIMETLGEDLKAAGSAYQRGRMRERREWLEEFRDDVLNAGMGYQGVEGRMYDMDAKAAAVAQGAEGRRMTPGEQFVMDEAKKWRQFMQWMKNWASSGRGPNWVNEQLRDLSIREDTVKRISQRDHGTEYAYDVYNELGKAYQHLMNPTTGRFAVAINSVGYLFHLAASPAAWVTNALQTPVISMPFVAARHGLGKTTKAFNRAFQDAMRDAWKMQTGKEHRFGILESLTKPDEINAYTEALDRGLIERGRVMDLIGTAEEGARRSEASRRWALAMSFGFHDAERLNREVSFMAAYRLERDTGASFETAVNYAARVVNDTHFNYAAENRARFMRGDFARVITQFKSYAQHVTYLQWRAVSEALGQDATAEQKQEARRFLLASTAVQFAAAGAAGLPLNLWLGIAAAKSGAAAVKRYGLAGALAWTGLVIGAMVGLGGDDPDDPIDWGAEIRQALRDAFGPTGGTLVSEGLFNALAGIDMSSRLSQRELWWRDIDAEVDDRQLPLEVLSQLLGAGVGTVLQILKGLRIASDGQTERGIEAMLPKMPKDILQAARFAGEGALSLKGDPLIEEFTPWEISAKAAGFTPSRLAARYQENQANVTREKRIEERRADLTRDLAQAKIDAAKASRTGDTETFDQAQKSWDQALAATRRYNEKQPRFPITGDTLGRSIQSRVRARAQAQNGIFLNRKIPKQYDYATEE